MFIVSKSLAGNVSGDNLSDHSPIVMNIKLKAQYSLSEEMVYLLRKRHGRKPMRFIF